jgi:hypothetical protein
MRYGVMGFSFFFFFFFVCVKWLWGLGNFFGTAFMPS